MTEYDPDRTPRVSGSYARWPLFRETSAVLAEMLELGALKREKPTEHIDIKMARAMRALAVKLRMLERTFEAWEMGDPGQDLRSKAVAALLDLREQAREMGVDTVAAFERQT